MNRYTMRAECLQDIFEFMNAIHVKVLDFEYDENIITFESVEDINYLIDILRTIDDAHVMYQTLQPSILFNNERNYDL